MKTKSLKADIAKKDANELVAFIRQERDTLRSKRFGVGGDVKVSARHIRKNIARALTSSTAQANHA